MSLGNYPVGAAIAVTDIARARTFYEDVLGLSADIDSGDHVRYRCGNGTGLMVFVSPYAGTAKSTQAGFEVPDIEQVVDELIGRGLSFEQYDEGGIKTDAKGIASFDAGAKTAYFKDPDGNILSLAQPGLSDNADA
jgi:catechol 2,3-dioxygenase-like lactoylglutathione lyase family enzyme